MAEKAAYNGLESNFSGAVFYLALPIGGLLVKLLLSWFQKRFRPPIRRRVAKTVTFSKLPVLIDHYNYTSDL